LAPSGWDLSKGFKQSPITSSMKALTFFWNAGKSHDPNMGEWTVNMINDKKIVPKMKESTILPSRSSHENGWSVEQRLLCKYIPRKCVGVKGRRSHEFQVEPPFWELNQVPRYFEYLDKGFYQSNLFQIGLSLDHQKGLK